VLIGAFIWLALTRKKMKIVFSVNGYRFIWLSVLPVGLLHFFFLNYSMHDFTVLYGSLFFSVLIGILYDKVKKSGALPLQTMRIGFGVVLVLLMVQYELMNKPAWVVKKGSNYKATGQKINELAKPDEVIFTDYENTEPQVIFYASRNIRYAKSRDEAIEFLKSTGRKKGILLHYDDQNQQVQVVDHLNL
jgi:hypothetical protein